MCLCSGIMIEKLAHSGTSIYSALLKSIEAEKPLFAILFDPEELSERMDLPEDKVRRVLKIAKEPISTETPIGDEEDTTLGDFIEDTSIDAPDIAAIEENLQGATDDILGSLTAREAKVLRMRFGIGMNTDHTLEEVGKQFDVTRERIRQIEAKALRKLRHPTRSSHLKGFLDE